MTIMCRIMSVRVSKHKQGRVLRASEKRVGKAHQAAQTKHIQDIKINDE